MRRILPFCTPVSWSWDTGEATWVNNLPKVATQWNSGTPRESNPGPRVRIPSALTTKPLRHTLRRRNSLNSVIDLTGATASQRAGRALVWSVIVRNVFYLNLNRRAVYTQLGAQFLCHAARSSKATFIALSSILWWCVGGLLRLRGACSLRSMMT